MEKLSTAFGKKKPDDYLLGIYYENLCDIPAKEFLEVIKKAIQEQKFFPKVAELIAIHKSIPHLIFSKKEEDNDKFPSCESYSCREGLVLMHFLKHYKLDGLWRVKDYAYYFLCPNKNCPGRAIRLNACEKNGKKTWHEIPNRDGWITHAQYLKTPLLTPQMKSENELANEIKHGKILTERGQGLKNFEKKVQSIMPKK